jgi:hypothetical protein
MGHSNFKLISSDRSLSQLQKSASKAGLPIRFSSNATPQANWQVPMCETSQEKRWAVQNTSNPPRVSVSLKGWWRKHRKMALPRSAGREVCGGRDCRVVGLRGRRCLRLRLWVENGRIFWLDLGLRSQGRRRPFLEFLLEF